MWSTLFILLFGAAEEAPSKVPGKAAQELLRQLASTNLLERRTALISLNRPENLSVIPKLGDAISATVMTMPDSDERFLILARLPATSGISNQILGSALAPLEAKARMGDKLSLTSLITNYEKAESLVEFRAAANKLLYVDSRDAMLALKSGFESHRVFRDVHGNEVSAPAVLISLFGRYHPEEDLFQSKTYMRHANLSRDEFRKQAHQEYLRQIELYFQSKHGVSMRINPPLLLNTSNVGIRIAPNQ